MKQIFCTLFLICSVTFLWAQKNDEYCKGWDDGYASGMQSLGKRVFTTPICPIPSINQSTYSHGFSAGYEKATGKSTTVIPDKGKNSGSGSTDAFCSGWEDGYRAARQEQNKRIYTVPVCPVPSANQNNYDGGFVKGYKQGGGGSDGGSGGSFAPAQKDGNFCDGWEKGYAFGLQLWAENNNKRVPLKITPVCPVPGINENNYQNGFEQGKNRAMEDMSR